MNLLDRIQQFDSNLLIGIQQTLNADWLTAILKVITQCGSTIFLTILCVVLLLFKKTRKIGIICTASVLLTHFLCNDLIKPYVNRVRPWVTVEEVQRRIAIPSGSSFPSGHSSCSMSVAMAWTLATLDMKKENFEKWKKVHLVGACGIIVSLTVGFSRMYLGVHYPSDVFCGWALGIISALIICEIYKKFFKKSGNLIA